jgi:hypothetical protein
MSLMVFWAVLPPSALNVETVCFSEMLVTIYKFWFEKHVRRNHDEDLGRNGRIIFE